MTKKLSDKPNYRSDGRPSESSSTSLNHKDKYLQSEKYFIQQIETMYS